MMKKFTKFCFAAVFSFFFAGVFAQTAMVLKITAPASIAGFYDLTRQGFGPTNTTTVTGPLQAGNPALACTALTNDMTGKIAFLERGVCNIIDKVKIAQNAKAIAALICTDDRPSIAATGTDASITIKSFMMERSDCDKILVELAKGTVTGEIAIRECKIYPPANVIWGDKEGQGDFSNGLNGWEVSNATPDLGWAWSADGGCAASFLTGCKMQTPTVCNGAVIMNGNELDVSGKCPSSATAPCIGTLTSPNISLEGVNISGLFVQFNQGIRQFQSTYSLLFSFDDGATYSDSIAVNSDAVLNGPIIPNQKLKVPVCGVPVDAKSIKIRFKLRSHYYFWGIDDVFLINEGVSDPQTNSNFWAAAVYPRIPVSQSATMYPLSDVKNNGNETSPNTKLTFTVSELNQSTGGLTEVFKDVNTFGNLEGCQQIENKLFPKSYTTPNKTGRYIMDYTISSDKNGNLTNDKRQSGFDVTPNIFSNGLSREEIGEANYNDFIDFVNPAFIGTYLKRWSLGNSFYFTKGVKVDEFKFGVNDVVNTANPTYTAQLNMNVYKLLNNDADTLNITSDERELVGVGIDSVSASIDMFIDNTTENRRNLKFFLKGLDEVSPLVLEDNTEYIFVVHVNQFNDPPAGEYFPLLSFAPESAIQNLRWGYTEATELGLNAAGVRRHYGTVVSRLTAEGDEPNDRLWRARFFKKMYCEVVLDPKTDAKDETLADDAVNAYPNPASTELYLDINLNKVSKTVSVDMFDLTGKVVISEQYENVRQGQARINTAALSTGMYIAKVSTEEGFITKKIMINSNK